MKTTQKNPENLATPGKPMLEKKFTALIKEAEQGEFMTEKEFNDKFDKWLLERKK
jgi:hypothetical protein